MAQPARRARSQDALATGVGHLEDGGAPFERGGRIGRDFCGAQQGFAAHGASVAETITGFFHVAGDKWPTGAAFSTIMLVTTPAAAGLFLRRMGRKVGGIPR
jgi:hypothetical protein